MSTAHPTSTLEYRDLLELVNQQFGYGEDPEQRSKRQRERLHRAVTEGLQMVWTPPPIDGFPAHSWHFLHPWSRLTTVAGQQFYPLPPDFGFIDGEAKVSFVQDHEYYNPIPVRSITHIEKSRFLTDYTGVPNIAAVRPVTDGADMTGQTWEIGFYPVPDTQYELSYRYYAAQNEPSEKAKFIPGGAIHALLYRRAVQAAAEIILNDAPGSYHELFINQLRSSIAIDARTGPRDMGQMIDSRRLPINRRRNRSAFLRSPVTYNNITWGFTAPQSNGAPNLGYFVPPVNSPSVAPVGI